MDLESLKLFLQLSRRLHFRKTSEACHVSPSTLSRAIQRREEEAGKSLFDRDRRSVRLTAAGRVVQEFAEETLKTWSRIKSSLDESGGSLRGELSIYGSVTACNSILPDILDHFRAFYPDVKISLLTGDTAKAVDMVLEGESDISVAAFPRHMPESLSSQLITRIPLQFIGPRMDGPINEVVDRMEIDWKGVPVIFPESGLVRLHMEEWFKTRRIKPSVYSTVSGHEAILSLVSLGFGVGVIPDLVLEKSPLRSKIKVLDITPLLPDLRVGVCVLKSRMERPIIRAFWESLVRENRG